MANKISRNGPCPCGSGKKYKKCCMIKEQKIDKKGPFSSEAGSKIMMTFMNNEVFPCIKEMRELSVEILDLRVGFIEYICGKKLRSVEEKYSLLFKRFLEIYNKWSTPDKLFGEEDIEKENFPYLMGDYFNFQNVANKHLSSGFFLIEKIGQIINQKKLSIHNRLLMTLSAGALVISLIPYLLKLFSELYNYILNLIK